MTLFDGLIVARIAVSNYDLEDVQQQLTDKLSELDFVAATLIGPENENK